MAEALELVAYPDLESRIEAMERDGFAYFPKLLDDNEIRELRSHMEALTGNPESYDRDSNLGLGDKDGSEFRQQHINVAFNRDPFFLRYLDKPPVIELWEAIHGDNCHIIANTSWITGPGRPDQQLHVDWQPLELPEEVMTDPRVKLPIFISTAHFYLNDLYEELGPTKFLPGSHKAGRAPNGETEWKGMTEKSILNKAGDVLVFRSEVWHRGSANRSDDTRYLLQVACASRWIAQRYPPYLGKFRFSEETLAQATPRQLRLMGGHNQGAFD